MRKKLILHIGTEKTGTTSIQGFLRHNRDALAKRGIALLQATKSLNNREIASACQSPDDSSPTFDRLGLHTTAQRQAWQQAFRDEVRQEIEALHPRIHTLIVSSEHLHSRIRSSDDFGRVRAMFEGLFETTQVIVYLRRQDRVAVSLYSTLLRGGGIGRDVLPPDPRADDHYYDYAGLLDKWAAVYGAGNILPRIFDRQSFIEGDLVSDFLAAAKMRRLDGQLTRPGVLNESISAEAAEMVIQFNQVAREAEDDHLAAAHERLRGKLLSHLTQRFPSAPPTCTRDQALAFYALFRDGNAQLTSRWFDGQPVFDDDFSKYPAIVQTIVPSAELVGETLRVVLDAANSAVPPTSLEVALKDLPVHKDEVTLLRALAQTVEAHNPLLALFLARQALRQRPEGPAIKRLVEKLRKLPGAATCEAAWAGPPAAG